jgi:hypothetical protein
MQGAFLIVELLVSIFLTGRGAMFAIQEVTGAGPAELGNLIIAGAFCLVGLAVGSHGFRGLRTRGLMLAAIALFGLTTLVGLLALAVLGVWAWLAVVILGLLGVLAGMLRLRRLA